VNHRIAAEAQACVSKSETVCDNDSMLIPRFTIRWLLGLTTLAAGVSLILSHAVRGQAWALGIVAGLGSLLVLALYFVVTFFVAWFVSRTWGAAGNQSPGGSPFAVPLDGPDANAAASDSAAMTG
jgi:hypothetical protein